MTARRAPGGTGTGGFEEWIERVRGATDIVEFIGQSVKLRRAGRNWTGLCPFHKEKTPSFSVNAERQFFHCFGCKVGGDVFRFVQETEKVGFVEAVELLSRRAGIPVPERGRDGAAGGQRARLLEALEQAAQAFEQWLADPQRGAAAREYLERRGLARDTVKAFRLGLAPPGWENLAPRLGGRLGADALVDAGLAARRDGGRGGLYDRFRNRLMIPLVQPGGAVVGFGARALAADDNPKYLNSPETAVYHKGRFLFALEQARRAVDEAGELIVVEGYFDAIALHQAGLRHTVATSGTALTPEQARLVQRLAPRVALTYDGDAAGQDAMMRSLGVLLAEGLEVAIVDLPEGHDPDTLVRGRGAEGWAELRAGAADPVTFIQRHVLRQGGAGDPRERALQAVVRLGLEIPDPIRLKLLLERAGQVFGLDEGVLQRAIGLKRAGQGSDRPLQAAVREVRAAEQVAERKLLRLLLEHAEGLDEAASLDPDDFREEGAAELVRWVREGGGGAPEGVAGTLLRELGSEPGEWQDWREELRLAVKFMQVRRLRRRKHEIDQALRNLPSDDPRALRLMQEIRDITQSLRDLSG